MTWSIKTRALPSVRDYASAQRVFERAPLVGRGDDRRRLGTRYQHSLTTSTLDDGSVVFSYLAFDHVRYHPDGTIMVKGYNSRSSQAFTNALLPRHMTASFTGPLGFLLRRDGFWSKLDGTPFGLAKLNRKAFNAVLRTYRWTAFRDWERVVRAMDVPLAPYPVGVQSIELLKDPANWPQCRFRSAERWREHIVKYARPFTFTEVPTLDDAGLRRAEAAHRRYPWLSS